MTRIRQHFSAIHQRVLQGQRERLVRAVVAVGFAETEEAAAVLTAQRREQFVETDPNEARPPNDIDDSAPALAEREIRRGESLVDSRLRQNHVTHPIVLETDDGVGELLQL